MPEWWIDSGASRHMSEEQNDFQTYKELEDPVRISLADNSVLFGIGVGDVMISIYDTSRSFKVRLDNVLHIPTIQKKLLSLPVLLQKGIEVKFANEKCTMIVRHYCDMNVIAYY